MFTALLTGLGVASSAGEKYPQLLLGGYACVGLMAILVGFAVARSGLRISPEMMLFGMFTAWAVATGALSAIDYGFFQSTAERLLQVALLVALLGSYAVLRRSLSFAMAAAIGVGVVLAAYGILTGDFEMATTVTQKATRLEGNRAASMTSNANTLGILCTWGVVGVLYFWRAARHWWTKCLLGTLCAPLLAGIVLSASRKSFVAVLLIGGAWLWLCYRRVVLRNLSVLIGVAVVGIGGYLLTATVLKDTFLGRRLQTGFSADEQDRSASMRTDFYFEGLGMLRDYPLAGVGLGNFRAHSAYNMYSHSEYVEVTSTTGLVGAALYFGMFLLLCKRLWRVSRLSANEDLRYAAGVCLAAMAGFLAMGFFTPHHLSLNTYLLFAGFLGFAPAAEQTLAHRVKSKAAVAAPASRHVATAASAARRRLPSTTGTWAGRSRPTPASGPRS